MRFAIFVACLAAGAGCDKEKTATITGPGLTATPASAIGSVSASSAPSAPPPMMPTPRASASTSGPPMNGPPSALFVDVTAQKPLPIHIAGCDEVVVTFVHGKGSALGETLATSDVLLARGAGDFEVKGDGTVVIGRVMPKQCQPLTAITKRVARAAKSEELVWAGGAMHAHLDLVGDAAGSTYVGRLEGTAPVAEHTHPGAWEVLCVVEGGGVATIDSAPQHVAARQVIVIPPDTLHSWKPGPNKKLVAIQMYTPPGPEQRFRKLAAGDADGGTPAAADSGAH